MSIEAMKQALEALEIEQLALEYEYGKVEHIENAITSLRQAIATEESSATQEPVAFASHGVINWIADKQFKHEADLYTHPQPKAEQEPVATNDISKERVTETPKNEHEPVAWDANDPEFDVWWDDDYDDSTNPYRKDSPAYWAWAGWRAARSRPVIDETAAKRIATVLGWEPKADQPKHALLGKEDVLRYSFEQSKAEQEPKRAWVGLTDDEKKNIFLKWYGKHWAYTDQIQSVMDSVEAKLKEKNA